MPNGADNQIRYNASGDVKRSLAAVTCALAIGVAVLGCILILYLGQ